MDRGPVQLDLLPDHRANVRTRSGERSVVRQREAHRGLIPAATAPGPDAQHIRPGPEALADRRLKAPNAASPEIELRPDRAAVQPGAQSTQATARPHPNRDRVRRNDP